MVFSSGRLPQDLLRSEFCKTLKINKLSDFKTVHQDEQDSINELNYKFKLDYREPIPLL